MRGLARIGTLAAALLVVGCIDAAASPRPSQRRDVPRWLMAGATDREGLSWVTRNGRPGHIFNVVNQKGSIRFLDGQRGGVARFDADSYTGFYVVRTR